MNLLYKIRTYRVRQNDRHISNTRCSVCGCGKVAMTLLQSKSVCIRNSESIIAIQRISRAWFDIGPHDIVMDGRTMIISRWVLNFLRLSFTPNASIQNVTLQELSERNSGYSLDHYNPSRAEFPLLASKNNPREFYQRSPHTQELVWCP